MVLGIREWLGFVDVEIQGLRALVRNLNTIMMAWSANEYYANCC